MDPDLSVGVVTPFFFSTDGGGGEGEEGRT
jgi:hypothetical protein